MTTINKSGLYSLIMRFRKLEAGIFKKWVEGCLQASIAAEENTEDIVADIRTFDFHGMPFRAVIEDGDPWFIAKDVCDVLGTRTKDLPAILDKDEVDSIDHVDSAGKRQNMTTINESGLYSLIIRSRKPEAKAFKKWVTGVVLPAIRKTGGYIRDEEHAQSEEELIYNAMQVLQNKVNYYLLPVTDMEPLGGHHNEAT